MSRSLGTNSGSRDSLNWRTRCGCKPCVRQMRCTELTLIPAAFAIISAVQCVVSPGGSPRVRATVRSRTLAGSGGIREGRVLSCSRPSIPARMNRSCQRHTVTLLVPAWRMISLVPRPSTVSSTIRARQTCFCRLFRSATIASKRARSAALTSTVIPSRMPTPFRQLDHTRDQDSSVWFIPLGRAPRRSSHGCSHHDRGEILQFPYTPCGMRPEVQDRHRHGGLRQNNEVSLQFPYIRLRQHLLGGNHRRHEYS